MGKKVWITTSGIRVKAERDKENKTWP